MKKSHNQTYFITGTNRGIGLSLVQLALEKGFRVLATTRNNAGQGQGELLKLMDQSDGLLSLHWLDVTSDTSVKECFTSIRKSGISSIDVMINNAGVGGDFQDKFLKTNINSLVNIFQVNTLGVMRVLQEGLPFLQRSPLGKMVSMTSKMGSIADNGSGGSYGYRMSKAALNMFHKNLALEFPEMVSLLVHPGWVKTDMGGPNALISARESAQGILKIIEEAKVSDSGKYVDYLGRRIPW